MSQQDILLIQAKIGDSFLRAFYPTDYRSMQQGSKSLVKLESDENRRLKTTSSLTSKINVKLARTIGLLEKEVSMLLEALDSVQNAVYIGGDELLDSEAMDEAMQRAVGGFDLFNKWREIRRLRQIMRELEKQRKKVNDKRKVEEEKKAKQAADEAEKAKQVEHEKVAEKQKQIEDANKKPVEQEKPRLPSPETKTPVEPKVEGGGSLWSAISSRLGVRSFKFITWLTELGVSVYMLYQLVVAIPQLYSEIEELSKLNLPEGEFRARVAATLAKFSAGLAIFGAAAGIAGYITKKVLTKILASAAAGVVTGPGEIVVIAASAIITLFSLYAEIKSGEFAQEIVRPSIDDIIDMIVDHYYPHGQTQGQFNGESQSRVTAPEVPAPPLSSRATREESRGGGLFISSAAAAEVEAPEPARQIPVEREVASAVPSPYNIETPELEPTERPIQTASLDLNSVRDVVGGSERSSPIPQSTESGDTSSSESVGDNQSESSKGGDVKEMVSLKTSSGMTYQVNRSLASNFDGFVKALEATGYKIKSIGGYANRNIEGSDKKSFHSVGAAIDINPRENPVTYGELITDMPDGVASMAASFGLGWGGSWNGKKDPMHFSAASAERGAYKIDRNTGAIMAAAGGKVHPQNGGTLTLIAEAGEPEYVVPQSKVENFAHEMLAARPASRNRTKRRTHVLVVPILT